ncbi:MAG: hypothetical protein RL768_1377 [Nitrospirota bacterium]|jgi:hypothetical protein
MLLMGVNMLSRSQQQIQRVLVSMHEAGQPNKKA